MKKIALSLIVLLVMFAGVCLSSASIYAIPNTVVSKVDFSNQKLENIDGIKDNDFSNVGTLVLSNNKLDNEDMPALNTLAEKYPNLKIILFFNKITPTETYANNLILGVQNVQEYYLNEINDDTFEIYDDYLDKNYQFSINYLRAFDSSTVFSSVSNLQNNFIASGYYELKISNNFEAYTQEISYGIARVSEKALTLEAGTTSFDYAIYFPVGLPSSNFYIETINIDGAEFPLNKVGEFEVGFNIYKKTNNLKDYYLTTLYKTVNIQDTTAPQINISYDAHEYVYINTVYENLSDITAVDIVDGNCVVTIDGIVDTSKIGEQTVVYTASDSRGNTARIEKNIEIIYCPVTNIELTATVEERYRVYSNYTFEINATSSIGSQIVDPNLEYQIYVNDKFLTQTKETTQSIHLEEIGIANIVVKAVGHNLNNEMVIAEDELNVTVIDIYWWQDVAVYVLGGILLLILIIYLISSAFFKEKKGVFYEK